MNPEVLVTKASGERAPFSEEKLMSSLKRAGAETDQIHEILSESDSAERTAIVLKEIHQLCDTTKSIVLSH